MSVGGCNGKSEAVVPLSGAGGSGSGAGGALPGAGASAGAAGSTTPTILPTSALTLHRLNRAEYNNTVRDLLGTSLTPADDFIEDELGSKPGASFDNLADNLGANPSVERLSQYLTAAKVLMKNAFDTPALRSRLLSCDLAAGDACTDASLTAFAQRAWRRPLRDGELPLLKSLVSTATAAGDDTEAGVRLAMTMVLTSPHFLFRVEAGVSPDGKPRALDGFELASRLSYFLWSTMPDDALFVDAASGRLATPEGILAAADRALADPRSSALVSNFAGQWLYTRNLPTHEIDSQLVADYPTLADSMRRETELFFYDFLHGPRSLGELLTADFSYVDDVLAKHYGLGVSPGPFATRTTLDRPERRGLLTQAAILTVTSHSQQTSPVKRGKWVLYNLLCTDVQLPANFTPPPLKPRPSGGTLRTQLEEHATVEPCKTCHLAMDPIGFALENYDAVGRYRTVDENAVAIDSSGTWTDGTPFNGAVEMQKAIAKDPRFSPCVLKNLYSYALGRSWTDVDEPYLEQIRSQAMDKGFSMKEVIAAIVTSEPFRIQYPQELAGAQP